MKYNFELMHDGEYQVRLNGEFVCYADHTNPNIIDEYLKGHGYESREDYFMKRIKAYLE